MEALIRRHDELERDLTAIENKLEVDTILYSLLNKVTLPSYVVIVYQPTGSLGYSMLRLGQAGTHFLPKQNADQLIG